jgi:hypothetical protein
MRSTPLASSRMLRLSQVEYLGQSMRFAAAGRQRDNVDRVRSFCL